MENLILAGKFKPFKLPENRPYAPVFTVIEGHHCLAFLKLVDPYRRYLSIFYTAYSATALHKSLPDDYGHSLWHQVNHETVAEDSEEARNQIAKSRDNLQTTQR